MIQKFFNKHPQYSPQASVLLRLLCVLALLAFSRILLYLLNTGLFPAISVQKFLFYLLAGLRFDVVALLYANLLYILMMAIPLRIRHNKAYNRVAGILFIAANSLLLIPNLVDSIYYRFTLKRLTADIFTYVKTGDDTLHMMPQFIRDFWYILVILFILVAALVLINRRVRVSALPCNSKPMRYYFTHTLIMLLMLALTVLGLRGGVQLKPVGLLSASQYAPAQETPLVLNSAFTIMRSLNQKGLRKVAYFEDENEMKQIFDARKNYSLAESNNSIQTATGKNVVILILESFSAEHIGALNGKYGNPEASFTPFLDSLITCSTVYDGYANGKRSIEGIPAILASLPTWMNEDFITSPYAANPFNSLAGLLGEKDYETAFFHGGKNGTMGFDSFCRSAGFRHYFGKDEYPDPNDYDGNWGIWDEPYLQYVAGKMNEFRQPFLGAVFTLSSHHPYKIPSKYEGRFRKGPLEIQQSIMYSDFALQQFFKSCSAMPWFRNTIFVITADHTSEAWRPFYKGRVGQYSIPVIFYEPGKPEGIRRHITAQQTDIMPTILDMLHYDAPFISFGGSLLRDSEPRFCLSMINESFQLIQNDFALEQEYTKQPALFRISSDSLLNKNIISANKAQAERMERLMRSVLQQYSNGLIDNKLTAR